MRAHPKLVGAAALAGVALLAAVVAGRPELVALAVPFACLVLLALGSASPRDLASGLAVDVAVDAPVVFEGDEVEVRIRLRSESGVAVADVELLLPAHVELVGPAPSSVRLPPRTDVTLVARVRCDRWGAYRPGRVRLTLSDRMRAFERVIEVGAPTIVRVHPPTDRLESLVVPARLGGLSGAHRATGRADGVEYAETRPYVVGDRPRSINWRASARLGGWWADDRHPDRGGEVVLFIDSFAEATSSAPPDSTLGLAVRAAMAITRHQLGVHDRVGMVRLGGALHWVTGGIGRRQLHAVVDAILDSAIAFSEAEKGVDVVPVRALPPRATVVALTPLLDPRSLRFLLELRGRGHDVAVIECAAEGFVAPGPGAAADVAWRWWLLERDEQRRRLREAGAVTATLGPGEPVEAVIERLAVARRRPVVVAGTVG